MLSHDISFEIFKNRQMIFLKDNVDKDLSEVARIN